MTSPDPREGLLVLAHNYVRSKVQDYVGRVGDSLDAERVLFAPDRNLTAYVSRPGPASK